MAISALAKNDIKRPPLHSALEANKLVVYKTIIMMTLPVICPAFDVTFVALNTVITGSLA